MQVGLLGLGKMGQKIAEKLMQGGHQVVVWNRTREIVDQWRTEKAEYVIGGKLVLCHSIEEMRGNLINPRIFWSMLPAGEPTETALQQLSNITDSGDVIIDGGNSYYKDTQRRYETFKQKGVRFLGIGVSGGIHGLENGFSFMVGGSQEAYEIIKSGLDTLAQPYGCHTYFGEGGIGHFIKMIHNGIEYGMMQALGEGIGVLVKSDYQFNLLDVVNTWQQGSIIEGFLLQTVIDALEKDPTLAQTEGSIGTTGEAKWTVDEAKAKHIAIPIIEQSLQYRMQSQIDKGIQESFTAKLIQAMRKEFGGHGSDAAPSPATPQTPQQQSE